jgi:hypothetical protein
MRACVRACVFLLVVAAAVVLKERWTDLHTHSKKNNQPPPARLLSESKFKQQLLPAWKPILSPHTVLPVFFFVGVLFIGLGAGLLVTSEKASQQKKPAKNTCSNFGPILRSAGQDV